MLFLPEIEQEFLIIFHLEPLEELDVLISKCFMHMMLFLIQYVVIDIIHM